ncbi:MAG: peptide ABC transporter ATP-binding protein [Candidatus Raymondbacteria bacterium RifOxyC12_full_50_8]|uniref:Peptide ABC transporter ATP-binding protein n=1 Tax=Candidatus Raymondbacteria bacterium RIFOXYD12_FULL_49_13 TaxID=1817890 RepID=A0A1F7FC35_UNCRA|nr:MAG: peptide ABC transporter ATP-binding protein [Candidatus Raymondbacteria bacterium RIFOXYA2_FULL_49_16]OGJ93285.1 MAG: peptide ABC transporter ATP-binding protein [Candidatus Raymondbacteria bacterium RifOxyB12_full_50_8]OGK04245.1 MAG: peptide ABC transporter ATP-binding protein [Candidatus Raymondbacteria bacterium RIFOXYD12_FULL_49_13]OGK06068.1 MAG: peptide ABC transporter ATP-binding protein [Candidatus Raymondbacteria bacterium RifOxyC12_full_50_8]OGP42472.1 MAG: peptide ABC transp
MPLLEVKNLSVRFNTDDGVVHAVDDVSFSVNKGETLCIVGESGCGKSVTALAILRLIQSPPGEITNGQIFFNNKDLLALSESEMQKMRGNDIAMVFQDPMTSLNPVFTCGYQIEEALLLHRNLSKREAREQAVEMLRLVKIPDPHKRAGEYPHQLSGGMRQRVMIAMALSCDPALLIADEPTTALDVTIQAQIFELLHELKQTRDMGMIFITHDLGIVAELADSVAVFYAGKVAERGKTRDIYEDPKHPYTVGLLHAVPLLDETQERLHVIPGNLPDPTCYPVGCRFYDRCERKTEKCLAQPLEFPAGPGHMAACFHMVP